MEEIKNIFIYGPNFYLEYILLIAIIVSLLKPKYLTALAIIVLLVRPNERMALSIHFIQVIMSVLLFVLILNISKVIILFKNDCDKLLILFVLVIFIQTLIFRSYDLVANFMYIIGGLLLYYSIIIFNVDDNGGKIVCYAIIAGCFMVCIEPIYYHYFELKGSYLWNLFHLRKSGRLQAWGMWANANEMAFIACVGFANSLLLALKYKNKIYYLAMIVMVPIFVLVVFLSGSRAGLASLLLILSPYIFIGKQKLIKLLAMLLVIGVIYVSSSFTPERVDSEASIDARADLFYRGNQLFKEYPIRGVGFNRERYELGGQAPHNSYAQAFVETGIFGGMIFLTYIIKLGYNAYSMYKCELKYNLRSSTLVVVGLYCCTAFYLFFGNQLLSILFFISIAQISMVIETNRIYNCATSKNVLF